jgi:hypothetical protein
MSEKTVLKKYSCSVPLQKVSGYSSLKDEHAFLALETDIRDDNSFRSYSKFSNEKLIGYSDYQKQTGIKQYHLGSSRSVHFEGFYLKGIGLTPLFPSIDLGFYHGSGHLLPSAAAREFLISEFVNRIGLTKNIVPCEGVLVSEIDQNLEKLASDIYKNSSYFPPCDRHLKSISIKPSPFLRFTNFEWYLSSQIDESLNGFENVFIDWMAELSIEGDYFEMEFKNILKSIENKIFKNLTDFFDLQKNGILWVSCNNNFTSSLRFLDLELPMVTSPNLIFDLVDPSEESPFSSLCRIELFSIIYQYRMWILYLLGWCESRIIRTRFKPTQQMKKIQQVLILLKKEIRNEFIDKSLIFDDDFWLNYVCDYYSGIYGSKSIKLLKKILNDELKLKMHGSADVKFKPLAIFEDTKYQLELGTFKKFSYANKFADVYRSNINKGFHHFFSSLINHVEMQQKPDGFLRALEFASSEISSVNI